MPRFVQQEKITNLEEKIKYEPCVIKESAVETLNSLS